MIVLFDSWAWIEYSSNSLVGEKIRSIYLDKTNTIMTTTINLYEVYHKLLKERSSSVADEVIHKIISNTKIIQLNLEIIKLASKLKIEKKLGMADSIVLASAMQYNAKLLTGDPDFKNITDVEVEFLIK